MVAPLSRRLRRKLANLDGDAASDKWVPRILVAVFLVLFVHEAAHGCGAL